jgi:hypothetical protein
MTRACRPHIVPKSDHNWKGLGEEELLRLLTEECVHSVINDVEM